MTDLVDADDAAGPPPSDGLTLVGETKVFLKSWQRVMLAADEWDPAQVTALRQKSRALESRARAADVSGLAHHLATCEHCFWNGEVDKPKLAHCLRNVSEVAWQWRQDLRTRSELPSIEGLGQVPTDRLTIEPPTLLEPPSVEMFESMPPPSLVEGPAPERPSGGFEQALEMWNRPSFFARLLGAGRKSEPPARDSEMRQKRRKPIQALPSLADVPFASEEPTQPGPADPLAGVSNGSGDDAAAMRRGWPRWSVSLGLLAALAAGVWVWFEGGVHEVPVGMPVVERTGPVAAERAASSLAPLRSRDAARVPRDVPAASPPISREVVGRLLVGVHGHGGIESPELADLLDEEGALLASGGAGCVPGVPGCELVSTSHELAAAPPAARARPVAPAGSWLEGLEPPGTGVADDARVREIFEFHTRNAVGRETFQELLFRCAAHRDVVLTALERYGLAPDLLAVPMVFSGCDADAESVDGGRGLWQLTAAAAKAYHLRVKPMMVDERLDPAKGTDAAVRLLDDLFRKTGSWELALAAFRSGPLALVARLSAAGDDVGYAELSAQGRLPAEAAKFVPRVQAFALILANLARFRFEPVPSRPAEATAALEVPPGTRLGLVARAAASSTTRIRELNPDVLGDRVPDWQGEKFLVRVPRDAGARAREALPELIATADHADECVPHAFDWGRQRFTTAMASRCEQTSAAPR